MTFTVPTMEPTHQLHQLFWTYSTHFFPPGLLAVQVIYSNISEIRVSYRCSTCDILQVVLRSAKWSKRTTLLVSQIPPWLFFKKLMEILKICLDFIIIFKYLQCLESVLNSAHGSEVLNDFKVSTLNEFWGKSLEHNFLELKFSWIKIFLN